MVRGHVYIVSETTLPMHLGHMFVGTSAGNKDNNIGLLADMLRVKQGDLIFFYIEAMTSLKGRFFGVFKASDNVVYHLTGEAATQPNLFGKLGRPLKLIYRKKIEPVKVFPAGVLEWIALDKLPTYSKELLWSLIYRKLKDGRGNTMLLPWETERLISLIEDANAGQSISGQHYSFNSSTCTIHGGDRTVDHNIGQPVCLHLEDIKKGEIAFQAYILQNLSIGDNTFCPEIFGKNIVWIGNEVFAGLGMQRIDVLTIEKLDDTSYIYRIIELKHPKSVENIPFAPEQLQYYISWAREDCGGHLLGGKKFNIKPILLALTSEFNSIPLNIVSSIKQLSSIAKDPEVWEANLSFQIKSL